MRLLTFEREGEALLGVRQGDSVVELAKAAPNLPTTWPEIFGNVLLGEVESAVANASDNAKCDFAGLKLLPPIPQPPKILCVGLNYRLHAEEVGAEMPAYPIIFPRWPSSLVGHDQPILKPRESDQFDYEVELLAVIGKGGRRIPRESALEHVMGYSVSNDGSVRDYQFKSTQWAMGKNFDESGSWGPEIVTRDEVNEGARDLRITCRINGETVQDSHTGDLIFDMVDLVHEISQVMTLEPGDIILTGTPSGVALAHKPPKWLHAGDEVEMEIEGLGILRNKVIDDPQ